MSEKQADYQFHSDIRILPWTIGKCADIKRALSTRANNARRSVPLTPTEQADMAVLYAAVEEADRLLRDWYTLPPSGPVPEWVRAHVKER